MDSPTYQPKVSINRVEELATILGLTPQELTKLSLSASSYFHPNRPEPKPDGTFRQTYSVFSPLSEVQHKIVVNIFHQVYFPRYLLGGIKDTDDPRDHVVDVTLHAQSRIFMKEDIKNFFPSIRPSLVFGIWKSFFCLPVDLCKILTNLTTYRGFVPQGARTSTYLANLVFWRTEPELEHTLSQSGCIYTRFVDDITISSGRKILPPEQEHITKMVYRMLFSLRLQPKRKKRRVMALGKRVDIHNLNVNSRKPTLGKQKKKEIRKAVHECEIAFKQGMDPESYQKLFNSTRGKVAHLKRFHPSQAEKFSERLELIKPGQPSYQEPSNDQK